MAHVDESTHSAVLIQGSGTFAVEAAIGTAVPRDTDKKLLVLINGAYGKRMVKIAKYYGIETLSVWFYICYLSLIRCHGLRMKL